MKELNSIHSQPSSSPTIAVDHDDDDESLPKNKQIDPLTSINNFSTNTSSSQEEEELVPVVIVHLDYNIGSKLLTNFYKNIPKLNSNILIQNNIFLLNEIIYHTKHKSQSVPPQLLYRGSRDGFKPKDFHSRCDNQGPTLTIIKSASNEPTNQIFGGFTTQSWESPSNAKWISDSSAFIFKINDNENENQLLSFRKFNIDQDEKEQAIYVCTDLLSVFGGDICIRSDCNLNYNSRSHFGNTYELPTNDENELLFKYGSEKAKNYLAGSHEFKVSEIEVFKIITTTTTTTTIQ